MLADVDASPGTIGVIVIHAHSSLFNYKCVSQPLLLYNGENVYVIIMKRNMLFSLFLFEVSLQLKDKAR